MVFSSFIFLFLFLPITTLAYFAAPKSLRNKILLLASLIFYAWGAPNMLVPILLSCAADYYLSRYIQPKTPSQPKRKLILLLAVGINVALLGYYKYMNFFVGELNHVLASFSLGGVHWSYIALPIGISFFTFQKISYLVDVYRGDSFRAKSLADYILYVVLFPQLIAGPIVRYVDVAAQIIERKTTLDLFLAGAFRFAVGLGKKVLIADAIGTVADGVFKLGPDVLSMPWAWIGIIAYAFQIYFDFSGYSDMAIGLGWIFGFHFKENFNRPYLSINITEFWRRWHISLSSFMREYLYYPLGGSQGSRYQTYRNLWIVFLISGLWHGAAWNFIIWGAFHGFFLVLDKIFWLRISEKLPAFVNVTITFTIVLFGWVLFRAESLTIAMHYAATMTGLAKASTLLEIPAAILLDNRAIFIMFLATLMSFVPKFKIEPIAITLPKSKFGVLAHGTAIFLFVIFSCAFMAARGYTPFLYFRF